MIDVYTTKFDPEFRSRGGSYPITIYAEAFWNFGFFSVFFIFILFGVLNHAYGKMIKWVSTNNFSLTCFIFLYLYTTMIQFVRGSGLDLWILYGLISIPLGYIIVLLTGKFKVKNIANE